LLESFYLDTHSTKLVNNEPKIGKEFWVQTTNSEWMALQCSNLLKQEKHTISVIHLIHKLDHTLTVMKHDNRKKSYSTELLS